MSLFANRKDANNTGIYFLFGKDESNKDTVYIGEAEKVSDRLKQHLNDVNYWNDCIAEQSELFNRVFGEQCNEHSYRDFFANVGR